MCRTLDKEEKICNCERQEDETYSVKNSSLFKLAWPIFIQTFLVMSLGYVDSIMLSNYSDTAVGAVGNANQVIGFLTLAFSIISSATGVIISQYLGARLKEKINVVYTVSVAFNLVLSAVISIIIFLGSGALLHLMRIPNVMFMDANRFMKIVGGFIFMDAIFNTFTQIFRSNGKTAIGMVISLGMNVFNILGDFCVLYGPLKYLNLGVEGVAISTTCSKVLGLIIALIIFNKYIDGKISIKYLKPFPKDITMKLIRLGVPTAGQNISYNISQVVVTMFVNTLGAVAITTKIYATLLSNFAYMYSVSVAIATSIIVGHAIGGKDEEFAYKSVFKTLKTAIIVAIAIAALNYLISGFTLHLFTSNNEIISLGKKVMLIAAFLELGRTCNLVIINSMQAAGDVKFPTVLGIVSQWGFSVGLGYILGIIFHLGLIGIWIGMALDEIVRGIIVLIRWKRGGWRNKSVVS